MDVPIRSIKDKKPTQRQDVQTKARHLILSCLKIYGEKEESKQGQLIP